MTNTMDRNRFAALAEAYGGQVARWPETAREAAADFMLREAETAAILLEEADRLDWALAQWRAPAPSAALQAAVLDAAPRPRPARAWTAWLWRTGLGAGLAAASVAGVMAGAVVSSNLAPASDLDVLTAAVSPYDNLAEAVGGDV